MIILYPTFRRRRRHHHCHPPQSSNTPNNTKLRMPLGRCVCGCVCVFCTCAAESLLDVCVCGGPLQRVLWIIACGSRSSAHDSVYLCAYAFKIQSSLDFNPILIRSYFKTWPHLQPTHTHKTRARGRACSLAWLTLFSDDVVHKSVREQIDRAEK